MSGIGKNLGRMVIAGALALAAFAHDADMPFASLKETGVAASTTDFSAAKRKASPEPPSQIACTPSGCQPVPAGCTPLYRMGREGYTGFDQVICK